MTKSIYHRLFSVSVAATMSLGFTQCGSVKEMTSVVRKITNNPQADLEDPEINTGCFIEGVPCDQEVANKSYAVRGSSALPNFRTALTYYSSALKLSSGEIPLMNQIDGQVWDNLPTYSSADTAGSSQVIAIFQMGAAGCSDFLNKGQNQPGTIANLQMGQSPTANSDQVWDGYVDLLVKRLWGETSATSAEKTALATLRSKAVQSYPSNTKKVAYLLCVAVASAPKAMLQ